MESPVSFPAAGEGVEKNRVEELVVLVDPFLLEALANPRHRLTVLRMELDIQRFIQNPSQQQFEFQFFSTSYLRCAAHRVAQYYGLQTMSLDSLGDGTGSRIVVRKTLDSRFPPLRLSDIPAKETEGEKTEKVKIAIRQRPNKTGSGELNGQNSKKSPSRTVEEREEEYEKARARIFSGSNGPEVQGPLSTLPQNERSVCSNRDEQESFGFVVEEVGVKDGVGRVAIFRDRVKDRNDPDYDRSYDRYAKGFVANRNYNLEACAPLPVPFFQYDAGLSQLGQLPRTQLPLSYRSLNTHGTAFGGFGCHETPRDPLYMQWPTPTIMYAQSYEHLRHASFQAMQTPFYQQPLSFDRSQYY